MDTCIYQKTAIATSSAAVARLVIGGAQSNSLAYATDRCNEFCGSYKYFQLEESIGECKCFAEIDYMVQSKNKVSGITRCTEGASVEQTRLDLGSVLNQQPLEINELQFNNKNYKTRYSSQQIQEAKVQVPQLPNLVSDKYGQQTGGRGRQLMGIQNDKWQGLTQEAKYSQRQQNMQSIQINTPILPESVHGQEEQHSGAASDVKVVGDYQQPKQRICASLGLEIYGNTLQQVQLKSEPNSFAPNIVTSFLDMIDECVSHCEGNSQCKASVTELGSRRCIMLSTIESKTRTLGMFSSIKGCDYVESLKSQAQTRRNLSSKSKGTTELQDYALF